MSYVAEGSGFKEKRGVFEVANGGGEEREGVLE